MTSICSPARAEQTPYISHKWEFPGGKIEPNESQTDALVREIQEELHVTMMDLQFITTITHQYPDFIITMHAYSGHIDIDSITLTEHIDLRWLAKDELSNLDWAAADIPIVDALLA